MNMYSPRIDSRIDDLRPSRAEAEAAARTLLRWAGVSLIPFAAFVAAVAMRDSISTAAVRVVIVANLLWAADSVLLLFTGWVDPTVLGYAFIIGQAVLVAALAEVQHIGLRSAALPAY